ncbi:MAG: hypothetical protein E2O39_10725 [Planctomycetota bacterium]|nr:MAG: hypothetical protein E2O39_10725 [Planctomycetota bacterium]
MDNIPFLSEHAQLSFRWIHVVAGVLWIGILYYFNWVNGAFLATLDGDTKKKVIPELMPRALFWFRWGAAWTWLTGVALLFVLYYVGDYGYFFSNMSENAGMKPAFGDWIVPFGSLFVGFLIYDILFKMLKGGAHTAGVVIWGLLAVGVAWFLTGSQEMSSRAAFIHVGALFGTAMAANVWMRIWPAQKRIITAIKNGEAPDPADPAMAGLRSKHNTYMSVPLILMMVSVDQPAITSADNPSLWVAVTLVIGFLATYALYKKVGSVKGF